MMKDNFRPFSIKTYIVGTQNHSPRQGDSNEYPQYMFFMAK